MTLNALRITSLWFCFRFIKGFITRNQPSCNDNSEYLAYVRTSYLTRLRDNLPKTVLEKDAWLTAPPILQEVGDTAVSIRLHAMRSQVILVKTECCKGFKFKELVCLYLGFRAPEEDLHSPHGEKVRAGNHSTEEGTGRNRNTQHDPSTFNTTSFRKYIFGQHLSPRQI